MIQRQAEKWGSSYWDSLVPPEGGLGYSVPAPEEGTARVWGGGVGNTFGGVLCLSNIATACIWLLSIFPCPLQTLPKPRDPYRAGRGWGDETVGRLEAVGHSQGLS